jgi:hemin uptake protein HemP
MSAATPYSTHLSLSRHPAVDSTVLAESAAGAHTARTSCACVNSTDILRGQKAVEISHNGSTYRLQATRLGKLILTK